MARGTPSSSSSGHWNWASCYQRFRQGVGGQRVGARKSLPCHRFWPFSFSYAPLWVGQHNSTGEDFAVFWALLVANPLLPTPFLMDRKGTPKNFCGKDFAELLGGLSGAICLKTLVLLGSALKSFRKFFGAVRAIFWLWGSFLGPGFQNLWC